MAGVLVEESEDAAGVGAVPEAPLGLEGVADAEADAGGTDRIL